MDGRSADTSRSHRCDSVFAQPYRPPFGLRRSRWSASTDPVEDVCGMEPPSSNAEPLRDELPAPVRAAYGLLVAADVPGDLECSQQAVWQAAVRRRRLGRDGGVRRSMRRIERWMRLHAALLATSERFVRTGGESPRSPERLRRGSPSARMLRAWPGAWLAGMQ